MRDEMTKACVTKSGGNDASMSNHSKQASDLESTISPFERKHESASAETRRIHRAKRWERRVRWKTKQGMGVGGG